jgi:hypothetical protein
MRVPPPLAPIAPISLRSAAQLREAAPTTLSASDDDGTSSGDDLSAGAVDGALDVSATAHERQHSSSTTQSSDSDEAEESSSEDIDITPVVVAPNFVAAPKVFAVHRVDSSLAAGDRSTLSHHARSGSHVVIGVDELRTEESGAAAQPFPPGGSRWAGIANIVRRAPITKPPLFHEHSRAARTLVPSLKYAGSLANRARGGIHGALRKVSALRKLQACYRGYHTRRLVEKSGIMNNMWVSPSAVRATLKDVAALHAGLGRLLLHVLLSIAFIMMVGTQLGGRAGLPGAGPDPFFAQTSLVRRMKRAGVVSGAPHTAVESPNAVWPYLRGLVDEFYTTELGSGNATGWTAAESSVTYLGCAMPPKSTLMLSREGDAATIGRGYVDNSNRLLHSLLVVQQRHALGECTAQGDFAQHPYGHEVGRQCIGGSNHDRRAFQVVGSETFFAHTDAAEAFDEEALEWSGYPAAFDLGLIGVGANTSKCMMDWFAKSGWIDDRRTKEIKAVVALYNANDGTLYSLAVVQWDFPIGGGREVTLRAFSVSGRSFEFWRDLTAIEAAQAVGLWTVFILYVTVLFVVTGTFVHRVVRQRRNHGDWRYALNTEATREGKRRSMDRKGGGRLPSESRGSTLELPPFRRKTQTPIAEEDDEEELATKELDAERFSAHRLAKDDSFFNARISFDAHGAADLSTVASGHSGGRLPSPPILIEATEDSAIGSSNAALGRLRAVVPVAARVGDRIRKKCCSASTRSRTQRTEAFWLVVDLLLLVALHVVWIWWIVLFERRERLVNTSFAGIRKLMVEPTASVLDVLDGGGTQDEALAADVAGAAKLIDADQGLIVIAVNVLLYLRMVAICSFFIVLRFFRLLQFHRRLALIGALVTAAGSELMHYAFVYIPVHLAMVCIAQLLYGSVAPEFHTFWSSLHFLSLTFVGDPIIPESVLASHSLSPYLFFWTYFVLTFVVLSNVLLSIIINAYVALQALSKEQVSLRDACGVCAVYTTRLPTSITTIPTRASSRFSALPLFRQFVLSLAHVIGRSFVITPLQLKSRFHATRRWIAAVATCCKGNRRCRVPAFTMVNDDPIAKLKMVATMQKGNLATTHLRSQLVNDVGVTAFQADRIVTQMQHWDRLQERRKLNRIETLVVGQTVFKDLKRTKSRHSTAGPRQSNASSARPSRSEAAPLETDATEWLRSAQRDI